MMNYILLDYMNVAFRAKHGVTATSAEMKVGMTFHIILNSIRTAYEKNKGDHLVVFLEGRSWRKDIYPQYKLQRKTAQLAKPISEQEEDQVFFEAVSEFAQFLKEKTNCTVIQCPIAEADDMIATWVGMHKNDNHVIVSTDSDYYQLLSDNVTFYNGIQDVTVTLDGFFDNKGKPVKDSKGVIKEKIDPEFYLFEKCVRGDPTDNIFSAYPGVRKKGSKNKVGIIDAYEDRHNKGFNWNNFFNQKWTDMDDKDVIVKDAYLMNKTLIDLTAQPDDFKALFEESINECTTNHKTMPNVGVHLMKFCSKWQLNRINDNINPYAKILNSRYV